MVGIAGEVVFLSHLIKDPNLNLNFPPSQQNHNSDIIRICFSSFLVFLGNKTRSCATSLAVQPRWLLAASLIQPASLIISSLVIGLPLGHLRQESAAAEGGANHSAKKKRVRKCVESSS